MVEFDATVGVPVSAETEHPETLVVDAAQQFEEIHCEHAT
jgi:hypothetical protein